MDVSIKCLRKYVMCDLTANSGRRKMLLSSSLFYEYSLCICTELNKFLLELITCYISCTYCVLLLIWLNVSLLTNRQLTLLGN